MFVRICFILFLFINFCFSPSESDLDSLDYDGFQFTRMCKIKLSSRLMVSWIEKLEDYLEFFADVKKFHVELIDSDELLSRFHNYLWLKKYETIKDTANAFSLTKVIKKGEDQGLVKKRFFEIFKVENEEEKLHAFFEFIYKRIHEDFKFILSQLKELEDFVLKEFDFRKLGVFYENKYLKFFKKFYSDIVGLDDFIKKDRNLGVVRMELESFLRLHGVALSKFYSNISCSDFVKNLYNPDCDYVDSKKDEFLREIIFFNEHLKPEKQIIMILFLIKKLRCLVDLLEIDRAFVGDEELEKTSSGFCLCVKSKKA